MPDASSDLGMGDVAGPEVERQLDELVQAQVVRDIEIANAHVRDLTSRLVDASAEISTLREQLGTSQHDLAVVRNENDELRSSTAFRWMEIARKVRRQLRSVRLR